jgi:hypothetical protein
MVASPRLCPSARLRDREAVLRPDASPSVMHPAPTPKTDTPYSVFDVAEFLQTRMQNARDERVATCDAKSAYSIGSFGVGRRIDEMGQGCGVLPRSSMPVQQRCGIDTVFGVKRN